MKPPIVIDFETLPIKQRPVYPPQPVGVAIDIPGQPPVYFGWGSPVNPTGHFPGEREKARELLWNVWLSDAPLLFHNAKFDLEVANEGFQLPIPPWQRVHDTQFLAYLYDPHARSLGLKELAEDLLAWPPEEKDLLGEWVRDNKKMLRERFPGETISEKKPGAWIWLMPHSLVGPYAIGDVRRTRALYDKLLPIIEREGMRGAYDRERELMPILLDNEREGMRVDLPRLQADIHDYDHALLSVEQQLCWALGAENLNFDADQDVAEALLRKGLVSERDMPRTAPTKDHPQGQWSVSKDNLRKELFTGYLGLEVFNALGYRNRLQTCLNTFMRPWEAQARVNRGRITTSWNQVRSPGGGTRTGRPSTNNHNFLNLPKVFGKGRDSETGYEHPTYCSVPPLPKCRSYVLPDEGEVWLHRDFNGQELRVFAHFEAGPLWEAYQRDPRTDPHAFVQREMLRLLGREMERDPTKVMNFTGIYGGGLNAIAEKLRCSRDDARAFRAMHDTALPGRAILAEEIKSVILSGAPIRTADGRLFFAEKPGPDGRDKLYKLINYLVQGTSAGLTKQALIDFHNDPRRKSRFLVTVYDEINVSAPADIADEQMEVLRESMERSRMGLTVPMLSDGKRGPSWGELEKCA